MDWSICSLLFVKVFSTLMLPQVAANVGHNMFSEGSQQFSGVDVTFNVFGNDDTEIFPVAYFDVNADKLTDVVTVSRERTEIDIFLASDQPPYLRRAYHSANITEKYHDMRIVSVRPGDFTGNGMADLMVTLGKDSYTYEDYTHRYNVTVDVLFCSIYFDRDKFKIASLECGGPGNGGVIKKLTQEPTVLDLNGDMVLDLLGEIWVPKGKKENETIYKKQRRIWFSQKTRDSFEWDTDEFHVVGSWSNETQRDMTNVSSNAFGDIDGDGIPELVFLTVDPGATLNDSVYFLETYEIVKDTDEHVKFRFKKPPEFVRLPNNETMIMGQPMLVDLEHTGKLEHLIPYCSRFDCDSDFGIYVMNKGKALSLPLGSLTYEGKRYSFIPTQKPPTEKHPGNHSSFSIENFYTRALTFRVGDYNLDGYPDLLGVMKTEGEPGPNRSTHAVLFENVPCDPDPEQPCAYKRAFNASFEIFKDYPNAVSASFYDIGDNGALDVIIVNQTQHTQGAQKQRFEIRAFQNEMNFDANFLKVMVLTSQECLQCVGEIPYGNVLPGATVKYSARNTMGDVESGVVVQTYRTSHMPLDLPSNVFGIGHSPNFIETLTVSISPNGNERYSQSWQQIIPNSQIVVVPRPLEKPNRWIMKLFLTPSDVVLKTFGILVGVGLVLATIVAGLEFKERREDRLVRQSEAHRLVLWLS